MFNRRVFRTLAFLAGVSVFSTLACAQSGEVTGYAGGVYSNAGDLVQISGVHGGTSAYFGGAAGLGLGSNLHLFFDLGHGTIASGSTSGVGITQTETNIGFGSDYGFGSSTRAIPYVVGEIGIGHGNSTASGGGVTVSSPSNEAYFGGGGGGRFFLGKSWGVKPEVQFRRYNSDSINTVIFSAGIFYQFGK